MSVKGDCNGWLDFYGCYSGAIITAATAYYILMKTLCSNEIENIKQRKHESLEKAKFYLADTLAKLQPTNIIPYTRLDGFNGKFKNAILNKCEEENFSALNLLNTTIILFENDKQANITFLKDIGEYVKNYRKLADEFSIFIEGLTQNNTTGILQNDDFNKESKNEYIKFSAKCDRLIQSWKRLGENIQEYIHLKNQEIEGHCE